VPTPHGAFYAMPKVPDGWVDEVLDRGVVVVPGGAFGDEGEGYVRISYATDMAEIRDARRDARSDGGCDVARRRVRFVDDLECRRRPFDCLPCFLCSATGEKDRTRPLTVIRSPAQRYVYAPRTARRGWRGDAAALASQVHPVFMLPPLAASGFGAVLAGEFDLDVAAVHLSAMFFAVYTAHVKDGLVDFHVRGEDDDHPLTERGCLTAIRGASAAFFACAAALWWAVGAGALLLVLPPWLIAYHHAPQQSRYEPSHDDDGLPAGHRVLAARGYYVQTGALGVRPLAFAAVLLASCWPA